MLFQTPSQYIESPQMPLSRRLGFQFAAVHHFKEKKRPPCAFLPEDTPRFAPAPQKQMNEITAPVACN